MYLTDCQTKRKQCFTPTLVVMGNFRKVLGDTCHFTTGELKFTNPKIFAMIIDYPQPESALGKMYMNAILQPKEKEKQATADSISR